MIFFDEAKHEYRLDNPISGDICVSMTTLIDLFKPKFREDYWSWYTALRLSLNLDKKEFSTKLNNEFRHRWKDVDKQTDEEAKAVITGYAKKLDKFEDELLMYQKIALHEWKQKNTGAKQKGTKFHNFKEGQAYKENGVEYEGAYVRLGDQVEDLSNLHSPLGPVFIPELRMYNRRYRVSGTSDKNVFYPNMEFDIDDWKTNEKIEMNNKHQKMLYVLDHLDDCNYTHYCIQVSGYAWMLEQYGYKPRILKFTHVELADDGLTILESTQYQTHYMKKEVENMLDYFDLNREELLKKVKK